MKIPIYWSLIEYNNNNIIYIGNRSRIEPVCWRPKGDQNGDQTATNVILVANIRENLLI